MRNRFHSVASEPLPTPPASSLVLTLAFDNHQDLVNSADVDVVAVTVTVPHHLELATAALDAGKAVCCEWPLGNGLDEARRLAVWRRRRWESSLLQDCRRALRVGGLRP